MAEKRRLAEIVTTIPSMELGDSSACSLPEKSRSLGLKARDYHLICGYRLNVKYETRTTSGSSTIISFVHDAANLQVGG